MKPKDANLERPPWVKEILRVSRLSAAQHELEPVIHSNSPKRWTALRKLYRLQEEIGHYAAYPIDWGRIFTPIEEQTWRAIRVYGLPFYPQYPIGRYFADFASPALRVVIECDGAAWHKDKEKDAARDAEMKERGWWVNRFSGRRCNLPEMDSDSVDSFVYSLVPMWRCRH